MLDINLLREHPKIIKKDLERRGALDKLKLLDDAVALDVSWRKKLS